MYDSANLPVKSSIGLIAGRGDYPIRFCHAARHAGVQRLVVVAMYHETNLMINDLADHVDWLYVGQLGKAIRALQQQQITQVVFAGQIRPGRLFKGMRPDLRAFRLLRRLRERNAETIFAAIAAEFSRSGIEVLPATTYMDQYLAGLGVLGKVKPSATVAQDLQFGWRIARDSSRLDIGQTVVVKRGTVLAVEAFEGTDKAIRRGGELGHGGVTVVKSAKPGHDMRFDVPCIGMRTFASLQLAGARALGIHAGKTLLIDRDQFLAACDQAAIAVVGLGEAAPEAEP